MRSARSRLFAACLAIALTGPAAAGSDPANEDSPLGSFIAKKISAGEDINKIAARRLFGSLKTAAPLKPKAIGTYALGCLAGAQQLPATGPTWQAMRLSRNRNWGMPQLVSLLQQISVEARDAAGWNGLLVGDMAQPRGGPMLSGHASHQIGLDADVWFTPMPDKVLSVAEREKYVPLEMVKNHRVLNADTWTESRARLLELVARKPQVARIFVHPPIKAELCRWAKGPDRSWLAKVRPMFGHTFHFHIRMKCPDGMAVCKNQWTPKPDDGTGCGKELAYWFSDKPWVRRKPDPNAPKPKPRPPLTLTGLPAECRAVVTAQ